MKKTFSKRLKRLLSSGLFEGSWQKKAKLILEPLNQRLSKILLFTTFYFKGSLSDLVKAFEALGNQ